MRYAFITRRGSLDELAIRTITVSSATELPTTERENTIAVISEIPSTTCFVCGNEPTDMKNGDFWITREDIVFSITTINREHISIGSDIGNVYQYIDGTWVERIAYIFLNSEWHFIWNKVFYDNGKISAKIEHFDLISPSNCKVTYNDTYIQCVTYGGSTSDVYAVFGPVDLTDMTTLVASGTYPKAQDGTTHAVLAVATGSDASFTDDVTDGETIVKNTVKGNSANAAFEVELDVSDLTGNHYVYIGTNTAGSAWNNTRYVNFNNLYGK